MPEKITIRRTNTNARVAHPSHVQFGVRLTDVPLPAGLPTADEIVSELREYWDVLLGRVDSPVVSPYLSLMEVATAYFSRAQEIESLIHEAERTGAVERGSGYYKLRTGELRDFIEMARKQCDLGSRRLTQEDLLSRMRYDSGL